MAPEPGWKQCSRGSPHCIAAPMTAAQMAEHFAARRTGEGRWMARCPAHGDRSASLSIRRGRKGTLLHCFAGCDARDVLAAVGLRLADLYDGPPATPEQWMKMDRQRAADERRRRSGAELERDVYRLESIRNQLGAKLAAVANVPAGDELSRVFHFVCDLHREAHTELETRRSRLAAAPRG
jgi:hypothetical protein